MLNCHDFVVPSTIEAIVVAFTIPTYKMGGSPASSIALEHFTGTVNTVLREHRISFELIGGEMVPLASQELHTEVVAPTLRLLSGRAGWNKVETAYQDALGELAQGKPAVAITDAATALQEALSHSAARAMLLVPWPSRPVARGCLDPTMS